MERPNRIVEVGNRPVTVEYATEAELLDFANAVREAGGAEVLDALLPSKPGDASRCLIANALNFGCRVIPGVRLFDGDDWTGEFEWSMALPHNIGPERLAVLAKVIGAEANLCDGGHEWLICLPQHIGNAADAFDDHVGWTIAYAPEEDQ